MFACDVLHDEGGALAERLRGESLDVTYRGLDVTDATAWQALVAEIGRVDVLINNAGIIHVSPITGAIARGLGRHPRRQFHRRAAGHPGRRADDAERWAVGR